MSKGPANHPASGEVLATAPHKRSAHAWRYEPMNIRSGIKLLEEREGHGEPAKKGDRLRYNLRAFLNKGEELPINEVANLEAWPAELLRKEEGKTYINFACKLGKRQNVAAVEYSLYGMKEGGYRKIKAGPHLAYGKNGVPGRIPANAVVIFEIWLREVHRGS